MSQVYIGDLCHVLPERVMREFQSQSRYFGDGVKSQWLYSEVDESNPDYKIYKDWYNSLSEDEQYEYDPIPTCNCDDEDDLGYYPEGCPVEYEHIESTQEYMFSMTNTWIGDGFYKDQFGNTYGVDMGCIGVVYIEDEIMKTCQECEQSGLGKIFDLTYFNVEMGDPPFWLGIPQVMNDDGTITIGNESGGQVTIITG